MRKTNEKSEAPIPKRRKEKKSDFFRMLSSDESSLEDLRRGGFSSEGRRGNACETLGNGGRE